MSKILPLGAINKKTRGYVNPKVANKKDEYVCPDCNKDLILCQGDIRAHYFRHKVDSVNPCHHYSNPSESQIHKDAKLLLKNLLERKIPISFIRECCSCKIVEEFDIPEMTETSTIRMEYGFQHNGSLQVADVAYLDNDQVVGLFEICHTHKTRSEKRPEPWFEIDAKKLIQQANDNSLTTLQIPCIRCEKCDECIEKETIELKKIQITQEISKLNKSLETITSWGATKSEKNKKSKIRSKIRSLEEELSLLNNDKVTITKITKEEKINELKEELKNIDTCRANFRCNTTNDNDDDADTFRSMRWAKQDANYKTSLKQQLWFTENDVEYTLGNSIIVIEHPLTHTQLTRSLVSNKTRYKGKEWRTDISVQSIIDWYKDSPDLFD
jgi:competence CoiA-like predicted nuclease